MKRKILSLLLTAVMVLGQLPQSVLAEEITEDSSVAGSAGGVISAFDTLPDEVCSQKVDIGTQSADLILPDTLPVTAQVFSEGGTPGEPQETELTGIAWQPEPEYDPLDAGEYCFTPILPEGWTVQDGVALPQITAVVYEDLTQMDAEADEAVALPDMKLFSSSPETYIFDISEGNITVAASGAGLLAVTYGAGAIAEFDKGQQFTIIGSSISNSVAVNPGVNAKIAISGLTMTNPFQISATAAVELTLVGTNNLNGGLRVPANATLTITAESTGNLTAAGSGDSAGIGGGSSQNDGTININGGTVTATTNGRGAAIGGGYIGHGGSINISGGTVTATTNGGGAAIGGGTAKSGGWINISGGVVNVTTASNTFSAGIGGGDAGVGGTITITGGTVSATTNGRGAAIGGGWGKGGNTTISGGTITATTNYYGAGIGGGADGSDGGTIIINGGDVTVTANSLGAGLGGGTLGSGGNITVSDGRVIAATGSGSNGAGIGGGYQGGSGNITISGGEVNATTAADSHGAGIGGGYKNPAGGMITVNGGTVIAATNGNGAGIGGGFAGGNCNITVNSGDVTAIAENGCLGAGIGGGWSGEAGTIIINGGSVDATSNSNVAGIGGGNGRPGGIITINGGTVNATAENGGAAIGGGTGGDGGTITITGGAVDVTGNSGGACIGGGVGGSGGTIAVGGGYVRAKSNDSGAGIGGGSTGPGGTVTISGGFIDITGAGPSIGVGYSGTGGTIDIQNAVVIVNTTGQAYGSAVLRDSVSFSAARTLTIDSGNSLTLEDGVTLINNGSIYNSGTVDGAGVIQNNGLIVNMGVFTADVTGNPVRKPLTGAMVQIILPQTYTGLAIDPAVTLMDSGTPLVLHVDYEVAYNNNINAGTASAIVTGTGRYIYDVQKNFSINKANPAYTTPTGLSATYGQTLADVSLPARFSWESPSGTSVGNVGSNSSTVRYTPADTSNYNVITGIPVTITVGKARPDFTTPAGLSATYGQTLADVSLPGGFSWENPSGTSVGSTGSNSFAVTYTPADTSRYNSVTGIPVTVTVGKAAPTVLLTATSGILALDSAALTATVTGAAGEPLSGSVTFKQGSNTLGSAILVSGVADYTWSNVPAGSHTLTAEYGGNGNYYASTAAITGYHVSKRTQTPLVISGVPPVTSYGDGSFPLSVSGGSGSGGVTYKVATGNAVQVDETAGTVTVVGAGQVVITAVKAGDDIYNSYTASVTIDVCKAIPTITAAPTASAIQSGSRLSASTLTGGTTIGVSGTALTGVFLWSNPSNVVSTSGTYEVTFSPDNFAIYAIATVMTPLTVTPKSANHDSRSTTVTTQLGMNPGQPVFAGFTVTPTVDDNGHATVIIRESTVADAAAKALADALSAGHTENGIGITLNIDLPEKAKSLGIILPQAVLNSFVGAGVRQLEINDGIVNLSFDLEALKEFRNQSTGDVTVTIRPAQNLSDEAKKFIGGRPVYDVTVSYEKNGKTEAIGSLNQGSAVLSIPYKPNQNEAAGYLFGVYVDENGHAIRIAGSTYDADSGSIILGSSHFSVYGVGYTAPSEKYTDVKTHWARESIDYAVGRGLFSGTAETTFSPDKAMDRGMLVTVLGRLAGADTSAFKTSSFTDVTPGQYCLSYVEWAYRMDIVRGIGGGRFDPKRPVTREQFAVILQNYARTAGFTLPVTREAVPFSDSDRIGGGYLAAVKVMQQAGFMVGGSGNRFEPKAGMTRAEVAAVLSRYVRLTEGN